jgi:hypothetical protein
MFRDPVTVSELDTKSDPVITAEPEKGKIELPPGAQEADTANEALVILFEPNGPNTFDAVTKEAV